MSNVTTRSKMTPSDREDFWKAPISKRGKSKPVHKRQNVSLLPIELIVQQFGTNYFPPPKTKRKKP